MELILMRHATTQGNLERRFIGLTDLPILESGAELARQVSPTLPKIEHLYVSPLLRCRQTAELLWPGMEMTVIPNLRETDFGPFEGKNHEELKDDPLYQAWLETGSYASLPVGESPEHCARRVTEGIRQVVEDAAFRGYETVGVVTHGGSIMGILASLLPESGDYYSWLTPNCGGYRLKVERSPLSLTVVERCGNRESH